jgi:hypothetical protein
MPISGTANRINPNSVATWLGGRSTTIAEALSKPAITTPPIRKKAPVT